MATSRLTSTFLAARALDPAERLTVTMAGIISGAMPTAMASEKSSASMSGRDRATLTMKMKTVSTAATPNRNRENRDSPTSNAVWRLLLAQARRRSGRTRCACPVRDHHAPARALVDDGAHEGAVRPVRATLPRRTAATDLATGSDSPVSTPSSHSSSSTSSSRRSAGTSAPMRSDTTSPGTRSATGTRHGRPVADDLGVVADLGPERGHRHLGPVLVDEAQADAQRHDHGDDHRVGAAAGQSGHQRRPQQEDQDRVPDLAQQHRAGPHLVGGQDVVTEPAEPRRGLDGWSGRPRLAPRASTTSPGAIRAAEARSSPSAGAPSPVDRGRPGGPPRPVTGPARCPVTAR